MLSKIRHYTPKSLLKTIYFFLFNSSSHICMSNLGTIQNQIISREKNKAIHIISFLTKDASVKEAHSTLKILKIGDFISLQNALLPW